MSLPPLAAIPPANIRLSLAPEEWSACLDAWIALAELTLAQPVGGATGTKSGHSNTNSFLKSYYREASRLSPTDDSLRGPKGLQLQKCCFRLTQRALTGGGAQVELLEWDFLAAFCHTHLKSSALPRLLSQVWKAHRLELESVAQPQKSDLTTRLESKVPQELGLELHRLAPVLRASPDVAALFMTGSDFLDTLVSSYERTGTVENRKAIVLILYLGLEALVKVEPQNVSLLSDHLYSLKRVADQGNHKHSTLADLVTNTPLVTRLRGSVQGKGSERLFKLLDTLETYRSSSIARPRKRIRRKVDKGKGKAPQVDGELHMHRMSLVTQVQDLFPDLGSGFILKLLDEYHDDVEQATAHLLDDSLPAHLKNLDKSEEAPSFDHTSAQQQIDNLAPRSTPPPPEHESFVPERRNVYDDDELDLSRLHIGKKTSSDQPSGETNKSAILSALAAFDSDDDERDDTYDVDDVGGTVDAAHDNDPDRPAQPSERDLDSLLYPAYASSPALFGRSWDVRRGQARQALKSETGLTDDAIEGWAIMVQRDPKRLDRLQSRFSAGGKSGFDGRQNVLERTSYRESGGSGTEDSDAAPAAPNAPRGGFRGRGRARGRGGAGGGRGRGGSVAGPSNDAGTAAAQRRKEESKGSRANHSRRDQRARKMGRGGFPG